MAVTVRALAFGLTIGCIASAQPAQSIGYGDPSDDETPLTRTVDGAGVGLETVLGGVGEAVARLALSAHPSEDSLAMATEADDGTLRLRVRTSGVWSSDATVTANASGGSGCGFGVAHEQSSGHIVIVYRKAGQSQISFRTHDGSLSGESSVDLGFSGEPDRVLLLARPGTDELLLAASGDNSLRAAVWDGDGFGGVQTIEGSFTGTTASWDAAAMPGGAGWMVGWARSTDSTLRTRTFAGVGWSLTAVGPSAGGAIGAVQMASDPTGSALATLLQRASNGSIHAARYANTTWSSATQVDGGASAGVFDIEFEGAGGALVAAWAEDGSDRLRFRRWDGVAWSGQTTTGAIGDGIAEILAAPLDDDDAVALLARLEETVGGEAYSEYAVYSKEGNLDLSGVSVTGLTGKSVGGVSLPPNPGTSHGGSNKSYGNNANASLSPGSYGSLSVGNNTTINLTAGTYRFKEFDSDKNGTTLACDTSGGDITFIVANGNFKAKNDFAITRSGSGVVLFHVSNGSFETGNNATIDAMVAVHNGNIDTGNNTTVVGHLYAKSNITVNSGSVTLPSWGIPGASGTSAQAAWAVLVGGGSASSPIELTADPWEESSPLPLAISRKVGPRSFRILRWTETPAFEN
jgi:hypothetical protein